MYLVISTFYIQCSEETPISFIWLKLSFSLVFFRTIP